MRLSTAFLPRPAATLLLLALAAATLPAHAQWKWKDKSGQITASDLPPPRDIPETRHPAAPRPAPPAGARGPGRFGGSGVTRRPPRGRQGTGSTPACRRPGTAGQGKADEEKLAQQRAENCRRARGHLAALETGQRIARTNEKGEREILDDKGRAEEMRRANEVIGSDCRGSGS